MKFAKQLKEDAVPEWRPKYLDYKQCKKKLKAAGRAIRAVEPSPFNPSRPSPFGTSSREAPVYGFLRRGRDAIEEGVSRLDQQLSPVRSRSAVASPSWRRQDALERGEAVDEYSPLTSHGDAGSNIPARMTRYGSMIGSPQSSVESLRKQYTASTLELPDPALDPAQNKDVQKRQTDDPDYDRPVSPGSPEIPARQPPPTQLAHTGNAYEIRKPVDQPISRLQSILKNRRVNSSPTLTRPAFMQRMMSIAGTGSSADRTSGRNNDVALEAYKEVDFRRAEFFVFLEKELDKIENFYRSKETEAKERLEVVRKQLHILRNHRMEEIEASGRRKRKAHFSNGHAASKASGAELKHAETASVDGDHHHHHLRASVVAQMDNALGKIRTGHVGETSKAMRDLGTPSWRYDPDNRDYTRKPPAGVSYRAAKRKLKTAIVEYYRGLELLKSYCSINQTAFRKITKKCDKTFSDAPGKKFMEKRVNAAHFMNSGEVDQLADRAEDLYARYFEQGNRKSAISKLRQKTIMKDMTAYATISGGLVGAGISLIAMALTYGIFDVFHDPDQRSQAIFDLQLYGGFLLPLIVGLCWCFISIPVFEKRRINYQTILQLERRNKVPYQELSILPAGLISVMAIIAVLDFQYDWLFGWGPVVFAGVLVGTMVLPAFVPFSKTRFFLMETLARQFTFGFKEVEFRDVLLGDILCSLTYTFGNIEMFFCLYATSWKTPKICSSSGNATPAMIFGFLTALPGIIRFSQCIRRFVDNPKPFPNPVNAGKYLMTILAAVFLSVFRRNPNPSNLGLFIAFASINSVYVILWDLGIDWSLLDPASDRVLLRTNRLFPIWCYYPAMIFDFLVRCNWILYVIFKDDRIHSPTVGFIVGVTEVMRRCVWVLFRVENEQIGLNTTNSAVGTPNLPYDGLVASPPPALEETPPAEATKASPILARLRSGIVGAHMEDHIRKPETEDSDDE